nr:competence protein CoiA family protein [Shewanella algae]
MSGYKSAPKPGVRCQQGVHVRYAIVDNVKAEPSPKLRGICPCCGGETISKCGRFKVHHWAHKDKLHCDPWWENESEWHRSWKNYFLPEHQEVVFQDPNTLERHIADVYVPDRWVIEFQSYTIDDAEARSREAFYKNMIWVVNGAKNEFDKVYFGNSLCGPHTNDPCYRMIKWHGRSKLLARWSTATKPVYFDFGVDAIWQLLSFDCQTKQGEVRAHEKSEFIRQFGGIVT